MALRIEADAEPIPGYKLVDRLGSGGFGEVWRCVAPGGINKAIKVIFGDLRNRDTDAFRFAEQELKALKRVKQVRHPYLLALDRYDVVDGRLLITMELADCNLWDRFRQCRKQGLPGIPRAELLQYMRETAEVLDLFDTQFKLQHLDIKPQNLFLLHNHVKVADFGQVKDLEGLMAQVTGGITPVYAAPETFDGLVSQYCDQYSLACVYQELMTGTRPFDGTSMQQLLMQHLQMPPNLEPSPPCDRPALRIALAKDYTARFPSVGAFVRALTEAGELPRPGSGAIGAAERELVAASGRIEVGLVKDVGAMASRFVNSLSEFPPQSSPGGFDTPGPRSLVETAPPPERPAPPLETGPGCLRPTLVVGLGHTGKRVLQCLRRGVGDRFGPAANTPLLRTLYVDTDPEALALAATDATPTGAPLSPDETFAAVLNRPTHYFKPRLGGRAIGEGWFDTQLLNKLPRHPVTMGYRALGRLAAVDHYRALAPRLQLELESAADPEALEATRAATGQELMTNRPRVYVVAGLGGGTGSGMLLDVAYAARARLRRMGYAQADVVGLLLVPPEGQASAQAMANTYAALTELHHYAREGAAFTAAYDERVGTVRELDPPFSELILLPGLPSEPTAAPASQTVWARTPSGIHAPPARPSGSTRLSASRRSGVVAQAPTPAPGGEPDPARAAADYLRLTLFTAAGPLLAAARPAAAPDAPPPARAVGVAGRAWPRGAVVARVARVLCPVLVNHWVHPDPAQVREVIPKWAAEQWHAQGLARNQLQARLSAEASGELGVDLVAEARHYAEARPATGWLARVPDAAAVGELARRWQELFGRPNAPAAKAYPGPEAFRAAADRAADLARAAFGELVPALVETPLFRLAGTEEAVRQLVALLDRAARECETEATAAGKGAAEALDQLLAHAHHQKGLRRPTPAELADATRAYPAGQLAHASAFAAARVYRSLRKRLVGLQAEVSNWRVRVETGLPDLAADAERPAKPAQPGDLLPPGCRTSEDAAQLFLNSLSDDDLADLDAVVQAGLEGCYGGLYQAGLTGPEGAEGVVRVLREQTRAYLNERLGEVDFAAMLFAHSGGPAGAADELARAAAEATPGAVGPGPWARAGGTVYVGPHGPGGDPVRDLAHAVLPDECLFADAQDELAVVREYADVPLSALAQLGTHWAAAYKGHAEVHQTSPHTRLDVTQWADVDSA